MNTADLDFDLPAELIAQAPAAERPASRLLHYRRADGAIAHRRFGDLPGLLRAGDLLIFNDARVTPARFALRKPTGGRIEGLFVAETAPGEWTVLLKNAGAGRPDLTLSFENDPAVTAVVADKLGDDGYTLHVATRESAESLLGRLGRMPLPPYIRRETAIDPRDAADRERYQTVFAKSPGSVAAPTAGLHFDAGVLAALDAAGVRHTHVTLHVGLGTFKPVTADTLDAHVMHVERYSIGDAAADAVNAAQAEGRRVIAVGTTAARVLESQPPGPLVAHDGETGIFIRPPYAWRRVDALLTNFHLPRSTLIALVAAFVGLEGQRRIYSEAIAHGYRFFSYGDTSFLE